MRLLQAAWLLSHLQDIRHLTLSLLSFASACAMRRPSLAQTHAAAAGATSLLRDGLIAHIVLFCLLAYLPTCLVGSLRAGQAGRAERAGLGRAGSCVMGLPWVPSVPHLSSSVSCSDKMVGGFISRVQIPRGYSADCLSVFPPANRATGCSS